MIPPRFLVGGAIKSGVTYSVSFSWMVDRRDLVHFDLVHFGQAIAAISCSNSSICAQALWLGQTPERGSRHPRRQCSRVGHIFCIRDEITIHLDRKNSMTWRFFIRFLGGSALQSFIFRSRCTAFLYHAGVLSTQLLGLASESIGTHEGLNLLDDSEGKEDG